MSLVLRKRILYVLLGLAVVWGVYNFDRPGKTSPAVPSSQPAPVLTAQGATGADRIRITEIEKQPWGADPFRVRTKHASSTVSPSAVAEPRWILSGIVYSDQHPLAIINDRPVGIGDRINGATVLGINKRQVTLETGSRQFTLSVTGKG